VQHEPAEGAFDDPASFDHGESLDGGVFRDDLDVDAQAGAVFDDLVLEAGVDPGLAQRRVSGFGVIEQVDADGVVADAGGGDDDGEQQAEGVGDDAAFTSGDLLAGVDALAAQGCVGGRLYALAVDDAGRWRCAASGLGPSQAGEGVVELGEDAVCGPGGEVAVDRLPGREVVGQVAPGDAGAVDVEDGVEDFP
jgi:hypothetical protein